MTHFVKGLRQIKVDDINLAPVVELGADEVEYLHQLRQARPPSYETVLWAIDETVHAVFDWIEHTAFQNLGNQAH